MATFLAGKKLSLIGIDSDRSSIKHGGRAHDVLGALHLEVLGQQIHGGAATGALDGIADGPLDIEIEGVAELVGLGVVLPLVPPAEHLHGVLAQPVLLKLLEQIRESVLADPADRPGCELQAPLAVLDQAGLL